MAELPRADQKARRDELAALRKAYRAELRKYRKRVGNRLEAVKLANRGQRVFSTPSLPKAAVYEWMFEFRGKQYEITGVTANATLVPSSEDDGKDYVNIIISTGRNETLKARFDKDSLPESQHFVTHLMQQSTLAANSKDRRARNVKEATDSLNQALETTGPLDHAERELAESAEVPTPNPSPIQLTPSEAKSIDQRVLFKRIDESRISWRTAGASSYVEMARAHVAINRGKTVAGIVVLSLVGLVVLGGLLGGESDTGTPAPGERAIELPTAKPPKGTEMTSSGDSGTAAAKGVQEPIEERDQLNRAQRVELLSYEILEEGDTSMATATRKSDALILPNSEGVTRERLEATLSDYITKYKGTAHAVAVYVYSDPAELGNYPPAFGAWQWAPGGEWAEAAGGNPATWDGYQWSLAVDPGKLDDPATCTQPAPKVFAAVSHFYDTLNPLLNADATLEFDPATTSDDQVDGLIDEYNQNVQNYELESARIAAEATGLSEEQVESAIIEVSNWVGC